ncbi:MAG TPA: lycopene cyclase family protein [Rubrobacter sp.]
MTVRKYDVVFVGGGLAAMLLLQDLRQALPERVAVVDPSLPHERPPVHWSYWSHEQTPYDRFAIGVWRKARVADTPPEPIAPFALRLVRSTDVFTHINEHLESVPIEWLRTTARSIRNLADGLYEIVTDGATVHARWVFDSAPGVSPIFPTPERPLALLSGTGIRVKADRPAFDAATATLFDPLDERSFAYLLPLSPVDALLESATFGPVAEVEDGTPLLRYLQARHPEAGFQVTHAESGTIPLGFAPPVTTGPQHILLGTKRGLVKPSAGYGIVRIAEESRHLARLWRENRPLQPSWRSPWQWRLLDKGFLQLAARDPRLPLELLRRVMGAIPLAQSLRFIDEELPLGQLAPLLRSASPVVLRKS